MPQGVGTAASRGRSVLIERVPLKLTCADEMLLKYLKYSSIHRLAVLWRVLFTIEGLILTSLTRSTDRMYRKTFVTAVPHGLELSSN